LYVRTEFGSVHIPEKVTASQAPRRPRALKVGVHSIKPESLAYSEIIDREREVERDRRLSIP
jgi:hypothetical protein